MVLGANQWVFGTHDPPPPTEQSTSTSNKSGLVTRYGAKQVDYTTPKNVTVY